MPSAPSASKNASCGLTATAYGATASTMPQQNRETSPRSSTGSRSGRGSRPTTSWLRFRSTSAASRSPKVSVATAIACRLEVLLALQRRLQLAAGAELRHRGGSDLDALTGARVDALARRPRSGGELAEAREVDRVAGLQRLGDGLHEGVDGLAGVAGREAALRRDLVDEVLLRQSLPPGWDAGGSDVPKKANNGVGYRSTKPFSPAQGRISEPRKRACRRTAARARASAPPSSRSTTQTAFDTRSPSPRRASTASSAAPPEVTTSSTRQTQSPWS